MGLRKRKNPTPGFNLPVPFNPIAGDNAGLVQEYEHARLASFQICEADTHEDYLVCRGYDPETGRFYDGEHGTISVAKPWHLRGPECPFDLWQVLICCKVRSRLGDNAGVAASSIGHPSSAKEEIGLLTDGNGTPICWISLSDDTGDNSSSWSSYSSTSPSSSPDQGSSEGTSKSTAIVPASWTKSGYAALFVTESPSVWFEDFAVVTCKSKTLDVKIDPHFVEVCDPKTFMVLASNEMPFPVGASVDTKAIHLSLSRTPPKGGVKITLHLIGARRGFSGVRFPERTRRQFMANERFLRSAYRNV